MSKDDSDTLDQIAQEIGEITEEQHEDSGKCRPAREGQGKPEEMDKRDKDEYNGGW